jgi:hypothetical protein
MSRSRWVVLVAAVASLSAGVAVAASQSSETTPVTAEFQASLGPTSQRQCDDAHVEFRGTFVGSQTSDDPRLTGSLEVPTRTVLNTENGYGFVTGTILLRDPASGRLKFRGRVVAVLEPDGGSEGFLTGRTISHGSVRLLANFNANVDETGTATGEIGKDSQAGPFQDPAVLTNACRDHGD